ncbi:MAG: BON domain-containing protein [Acidobacteriota bacterium]
MIRALFYLLILAGLAWGAFQLLEKGELPVVGEAFDDAKLLASVKAALALHRDLSHRPISVGARGGVVTLTGEVAGASEKRGAEDVAASVEGVQRVENLIAVNADLAPSEADKGRSLGQRLDDAALLAKVKAALALHRELSKLDVKVSVQKGTVYLEGEVRDPQQAELARDWVLSLGGVSGVEDRLRVSGESGSTPELAARIEAALTQNENLRAYGLTVSVRQDTLVLRGEVATGAERQLAELLAERLIGDRKLQNEIRVTPSP